MSVKRIKTDTDLLNNSFKLSRGNTSVAIPDAPTIGTATAGAVSATVTYTAAILGATATSFTATSSPGSFTGTGSSPITVSGLTGGTPYTFTVTASNANGTSPASAASNSVTPASATSYESISTVTVGAGGSSSITFSSIPSTYKHLQIRMIARGNYAGSDDDIKATFNSDTSNAATHLLYGTGSSAAAYAATTGLPTAGRFAGASASSNVFGVSVADILDYTNTNKYKTVRTLCGVDNNGSGIIILESTLWLNTSAITDINLKPVSGTSFSQYSSFALYGVKG